MVDASAEAQRGREFVFNDSVRNSNATMFRREVETRSDPSHRIGNVSGWSQYISSMEVIIRAASVAALTNTGAPVNILAPA